MRLNLRVPSTRRPIGRADAPPAAAAAAFAAGLAVGSRRERRIGSPTSSPHPLPPQRVYPRQAVEAYLAAGVRSDGRPPGEARPASSTPGGLPGVAGSCLARLGDTACLAAVRLLPCPPCLLDPDGGDDDAPALRPPPAPGTAAAARSAAAAAARRAAAAAAAGLDPAAAAASPLLDDLSAWRAWCDACDPPRWAVLGTPRPRRGWRAPRPPPAGAGAGPGGSAPGGPGDDDVAAAVDAAAPADCAPRVRRALREALEDEARALAGVADAGAGPPSPAAAGGEADGDDGED